MQTIPLFTYDRTLQDFLRQVNPNFSEPQLDNAARICQGLMSSLSHKSLSTIADSPLIPRDQSSLNRFLTESDWGAEVPEIEDNALIFMQQQGQTAITSEGVISLDDKLLEKAGSEMELVGKHFDHCSFTMKRGLSLVSMNYCSDTKNYNLRKKVYLRKAYLAEKNEEYKFKTKIELACEMIEGLVSTIPSLPPLCPHFTFDSWFLAKDITNLLEKYGLRYVSRAKSNRVIKGLQMNLKKYAATVLSPSDFTPCSVKKKNKIITVYSYTNVLPISNLGDVKVVFLKGTHDELVSCLLVSNNLRLSTKELIELYKVRWDI